MITKTRLVAAIAALIVIEGPALADEPGTICFIDRVQSSSTVQRLYLVDGELLTALSGSSPRVTQAKDYESVAWTFAISRTKDGALIRLRPKHMLNGTQTAKMLARDGLYLTGDYSAKVPTIKFTKAIEKTSYWDIPATGTIGQIKNKNDRNIEAFLSVGTMPKVYGDPTSADTQLEFLPLILATEADDKFRIKEFDRHDVGK